MAIKHNYKMKADIKLCASSCNAPQSFLLGQDHLLGTCAQH